MKILKALRGLLADPATADINKRDGVFVARYLLPENAKKWHDWGVRHGIPGLLPQDELHVTVVHSQVDVKLPMAELPITVKTTESYGDAGVFCLMGPNNEALVYAFCEWALYNRHHEFVRNGAVTKFPTYRPHLTLTHTAGDYELPDAALADVPTYILLGPEVNRDLKKPDPSEGNQDGAEDCDEGDDILVVVIEVAREAAKAALEVDKEAHALGPMDTMALKDVELGRVTRGVAKRLASAEWATDEIKALATAEKSVAATIVRKRAERDFEITVSALPQDLAKKLSISDLTKSDDEQRIVKGMASVSTIKGQLVKDLQGDEVTTQALADFNRSLISGTRAGKFDHEGDVRTEIVGGLVLSDDWQKALGVDLGFEPYLVEIHVPGDEDWAEVKKGDWMLSIAGRMWYYEEAGDAEV